VSSISTSSDWSCTDPKSGKAYERAPDSVVTHLQWSEALIKGRHEHGVTIHEHTSSKSAAKLRGRRFSATMPRVFRFLAGLPEPLRLSFFRLFGPLLHVPHATLSTLVLMSNFSMWCCQCRKQRDSASTACVHCCLSASRAHRQSVHMRL